MWNTLIADQVVNLLHSHPTANRCSGTFLGRQLFCDAAVRFVLRHDEVRHRHTRPYVRGGACPNSLESVGIGGRGASVRGRGWLLSLQAGAIGLGTCTDRGARVHGGAKPSSADTHLGHSCPCSAALSTRRASRHHGIALGVCTIGLLRLVCSQSHLPRLLRLSLLSFDLRPAHAEHGNQVLEQALWQDPVFHISDEVRVVCLRSV
mmetsp:Transcript_24671/g.62148  ORF Transcript_24671/g.62148 Transcript_24671/m.62148 type:complete len:206 (+) Transcript_24671:398-1015(+)